MHAVRWSAQVHAHHALALVDMSECCRSLGVHHSFVLSCTLDDWTDEQVDFMEQNGNKAVNAHLEFCVPKAIEAPFRSLTSREEREQYIHAKYVEQLFSKQEGRTERPRPPERNTRRLSHPVDDAPKVGMVEFIGILDVTLVECQDLVIKDIISSDPYCLLSVGLQTRKSSTKQSNLNPKYNEHFSFSWDGIDKLVVTVFDEDDLSKDDHMGVATVDLSPLLKAEGIVMREWFPIVHRKHHEKQQGKILLEIQFIALK